jgi:hypothetical protein
VSGGGLDGDPVAERDQFGEMAADSSFGVDTPDVVVGTQVLVAALAGTDQSRGLDLFACREAWARAPSSRHLV